MNDSELEKLNAVLRHLAEALDIPDHLHEVAIQQYEEIGEWLASDDSELKVSSPIVFPQGSFRLGTVTRPISERDEYDVDLVCRLEIKKESITQEALKNRIGDRLKLNGDFEKALEELRRCWRINCDGQLHIDVLPVIPNVEKTPNGILLTDRKLTRWQKSNPIDYSEWFRNRMSTVFLERRAQLAKSLNVDVEDVPDWQIKTPLQRAVQLLKRHRDIHFSSDLEDRPVSIVITTLAAHAYSGEHDLIRALSGISQRMKNFIKYENGKYLVLNPVDSGENFADKWNEEPARREKFMQWLGKAENDIKQIIGAPSFGEAQKLLLRLFGKEPLAKALNASGETSYSLVDIRSSSAPNVPALADASHCQAPQWPVQNSYKASVKGQVYGPGRKRKLWGLTDRAVPKGLSIRFRVETNVPAPYSVKWQVVNTGREAARLGQLRGDFYDSEGGSGAYRWENTKYPGTHWVEAFIVKNGVCVARSGRRMIKIW